MKIWVSETPAGSVALGDQEPSFMENRRAAGDGDVSAEYGSLFPVGWRRVMRMDHCH
jgi:hypothetical protein